MQNLPEQPRARRSRSRALARGARWLATASWVILGFFCLVVGDQTPTGEFLTIWPPFFWCFPLLPVMALGLERRRLPRTSIPMCFMIGFLVATVEWPSLLRRTSPRELEALSAAEPMRIVSWNINSGSGSATRQLDELKTLAPDICFIQESSDAMDLSTSETLRGEWQGYDYLDAGDCAMLSRYPLRALPGRRIGPWEAPQINLATLDGGRSLLLINARLMLPSLTLNPLARRGREALVTDHGKRLLQFRNLAQLIEELTREHPGTPIILAGDFNTPGGAHSLRALEPRLRDAWLDAGQGWGGTMTREFPVSRIDQCWHSHELVAAQARVMPLEWSDHRALVVDFIVPRN